MTDFAKQIEILLLDNDCVIVPGFGGFMAHYAVSQYTEDEALFLPPQRTVGFNPKLTINDSLLAQSYVETYDISYPEALRRIEEDVNEIRQHLANEGVYEFENVGVLRVDDTNTYDFQPCLSGILTPSLYALNSFEMKPLETVVRPVAEKPVAVVESMEKPQVVDENDVEDKLGEEFDEEENPRVISINVATLKRVAAAAAVLVFFVLISLPIGDGTRSHVRLCSLDSGILYRLMPGMEVSGSVPSFLVEPAAETAVEAEETTVEENTVEEKVAETEVVEETKSSYVIVLASCVGKKSSEEFVENLKNKGIKDARVLEKGVRRVICGNFDDEASARNGLRELQSVVDATDAWVLHVE